MDVKYFFSYAREDSEFVLKVATELRAIGVVLWLDQLDILGGQRWDRAVEGALQTCQGMIACLSPDSLSSDNVMDEVSYALEKGKFVVPILLRSCDVPFRLRRLQYIDFTGSYSAGLSRLLKALQIDQPRHSSEPDEPKEPIVPNNSNPSRDIHKEVRSLQLPTTKRADDEGRRRELSGGKEFQVPSLAPSAPTHVAARNEPYKPILRDQPAAASIPVTIAVPDPEGAAANVRTTIEDVSPEATKSGIWLWLDRLLPAGTIVMSLVLFGIGIGFAELTRTLTQFVGATIKIIAFLCPSAVAIICASGIERSKSRSIIVPLALLSLTAPLISIFDMRSAIEEQGSATLSATAGGLIELFLGAPFLIAAGLAVAIVTLPRRSQHRYRTIIVGLATAGTFCVLVSFFLLRDLNIAAKKSGSLTGLGRWIVELVAPDK